MLRPFACLVAAVVAIAGCPSRPEAPRLPSARPADTLRYATGFALEARPGYQDVDTPSARFRLVPREAPAPPAEGRTLVRVPVERVVTLSTTHLGFLVRLGAAGRVVGVSGGPWVFSPALRARLAAGSTADLGTDPSAEAIVALRPDVVFVSSTDGDPSPLPAQLAGLGIAVVPVGEYRETTPLGRAEWLRFFGAFLARPDTARAAFDTVAARYERLAEAARTAAPRPTVLLNSPYRGVWYTPGGRGFAARQIEDAGGAYPWASDPSVASLPLSFEQVIDRARGADVWLAPGAWTSLADGARQDARVALFEAFRAGRVYNLDARLSPGGGFDVYETGVVQPDVVLADLVAILHPSLRPGHCFTYYRQLPETSAVAGHEASR